MALYTVLHFPDPRLREQAQTVTDFDDNLQKLIDDMFETMYHENGVGLAATQIGIPLRISVIDPANEVDKPMVIINPIISETEDFVKMEEGCLSVPYHYDTVDRARRLKLNAQDRFGKAFELIAEGQLAHILQHETDHLNGKLYIDYLSALKRSRIRDKIEKNKRLNK